MRFETATLSETGPRSINEGEVSCWSPADGAVVAAVADGLGGMGGGGDASRIAVQTLRRLLGANLADAPGLRAIAEAAHKEIVRAQQASPELPF